MNLEDNNIIPDEAAGEGLDPTRDDDTGAETVPDEMPSESAGLSLPATLAVDRNDPAQRNVLKGMYMDWFLDYASYVILERAVPHMDDGLKPVQRRILHAMKQSDDGAFKKVANIVGNTMHYHPHGDASIYSALVQLGQKDMLIERQGNWGNILTGASAAAGRYIEARLSQLALDILFNPKVTDWTMSYDGTKPEPVTLPAKFPLLLTQGAEGIAVGLSSKILPHNFNEICDAAVAYLSGQKFELFPDFVTGGFIDVSRYNDGRRGGAVKIRAKIEKVDSKTLAITEIPYGQTTGSVIDSILKAFESGKIKIRKVVDNTSRSARILVYLLPGTSSDKTIDALYAFTACEVSVSPNCCVIEDNHPRFVGVSDVLSHSAEKTRALLKREFEIKRDEVSEQLFMLSLERIFIEERIYKDKAYEQARNREEAVRHIHKRLEPFKASLLREVTDEDVIKLFDIKMGRILRFNVDKCEEQIAAMQGQIAELNHKLEHLTECTIEWFKNLKAKYGEHYPRRTVIRGFDAIRASAVAEANEKLYINREEGFIGTALKKDELLCPCSSIDDIIIFYRDGRYKVVKVQDKLFVGKNVLFVDVFRRNDTRTIYNVIYQDGKGGPYYMKRFNITGVTRDKEYNVTQGTPGSRVAYFSANPNGEAEVVKVILKPKPRLAKLHIDVDFGALAIKGKASRGNLVTKNDVYRINLKEKGASTLGGVNVWFDPDVLRLNYNSQGNFLGEFAGTDLILVITKNGEYYTTTFDVTNHFDNDILRIEKFRPGIVWTAVLFDADQGYPYLKRFVFEPSGKRQRFIGENPKSTLLALTDKPGARFLLTFGGEDEGREPLEVIARDFVAPKSFKAKGKRLTTWKLANVEEIEPLIEDPIDEEPVEEEPSVENVNPDAEPEQTDEELRDSIIGQTRLF